MEVKILEEDEVLIIHDSVLADSGGLAGLGADRSLASALHRINDHITYGNVSDLQEIAALYAIAIAQGHTFNDGNKRTAMISMVSFLLLNNFTLEVSDTEIENMMVDIAEKKITQAELTDWIKQHSCKNT